jgi:ERCC4-type nuclease
MKTEQFTLAIDKRERAILAILSENKESRIDGYGKEIKWRAEHLTIGDYIIFYGDRALVVIERKTWTDLAASFRDGRKENIRKLNQYREQTNARVAYLIEGTAAPASTTRFARIPYRNLRAHLDHLLIRDNIIELHSTNLRSTVDRLFEFIRNISTLSVGNLVDKVNHTSAPYIAGGEYNYNVDVSDTEGRKNDSNVDGAEGRETDFNIDANVANAAAKETTTAAVPITPTIASTHLELAKVQFKNDNASIIERLWCCVPAISTNSVKLFREYHIADLLLGNIAESTIAQLQYTNGRTLGAKKAKKIFAVSKLASKSNAPIYLRILSTVPSISRDTASKILAAFSMQRILTEWRMIKPDLINLSRGKTRLGTNAVATIERFLIKQAVL